MRLSDLRAAIDREGPSAEARAVWWAIAAHTDGDGNAFPSAAILARMAGMSTRHVSRQLRELERFGMIETTRTAARKNRYHVVTSHEPQLRFPTGHADVPVSTFSPDDMTSVSAHADQDVMTLLTASSAGSTNEGDIEEGAGTSRSNTNGSAATPLRGGGSECAKCRRPILFAHLPSGRLVALDPEPDPTGTYALLPGDRAVQLSPRTATESEEVRGRLRRRHDDVCEDVSAFKDLVGATRTNPTREQSRARKLRRENGR